jgi:hypothetical protein
MAWTFPRDRPHRGRGLGRDDLLEDGGSLEDYGF